jgi:hypothetical protein
MRTLEAVTLSLGLCTLGACGPASPGEQALKNALDAVSQGVPTTLTRGGEWRQFYFDCMQAQPCQLDLTVHLSDATLATRLAADVQTRPMGSLLKTSQLLLYTPEHDVNLRFDQGVFRDPTSGGVTPQETVNLTDQPNNTRYHVSVAFPVVADDSDAAKVLPSSIDVMVRAAWK